MPPGSSSVAAVPGQPGLHRPRKSVALPGLAEGEGLGSAEPGATEQLAGCLGLGFKPSPDRLDLARLQRQPGGEHLASHYIPERSLR